MLLFLSIMPPKLLRIGFFPTHLSYTFNPHGPRIIREISSPCCGTFIRNNKEGGWCCSGCGKNIFLPKERIRAIFSPPHPSFGHD